MAWIRTKVKNPIPPEVAELLAPVETALHDALPLLQAISGLLDIAKVFVVSQNDIFQGLFTEAKAQIEDTVTNWFQDGVFELVVSPWTLEGTVRTDLETGIPKLSPADVISAMITSFDDIGDANRPRLRSTEKVTAFGILLSAPTAVDLYALLLQMKEVFTWSNLDFDLYRLGRALRNTDRSRLPDWESVSSRSFFPFTELDEGINLLIQQMNGTTVTADKALLNLISAVQGKFFKVIEIINRINNIIERVKKINGVFFFDLPPTLGGNAIIQARLTDRTLQDPCAPEAFSMGVLMVGSGASFHSVNVLRGLLKGEPTENLPLS